LLIDGSNGSFFLVLIIIGDSAKTCCFVMEYAICAFIFV